MLSKSSIGDPADIVIYSQFGQQNIFSLTNKGLEGIFREELVKVPGPVILNLQRQRTLGSVKIQSLAVFYMK